VFGCAVAQADECDTMTKTVEVIRQAGSHRQGRQ
jgi:hypothetical protein